MGICLEVPQKLLWSSLHKFCERRGNRAKIVNELSVKVLIKAKFTKFESVIHMELPSTILVLLLVTFLDSELGCTEIMFGKNYVCF